MHTNKLLEIEYADLNYLISIIGTFQEIAAMRMRKTKTSVIHSREYLQDMNNVYFKVKSTYKNELGKIKMTKSHNGINSANENPTAYIMLSANSGLYGDVIRKTFDLLLSDLSKDMKENDKLVVVGRLGKVFLENAHVKTPYIYFDLTDGVINPEDGKELATYVLNFDNIIVYHPLFGDILSQKPTKTYVTGENATKLVKEPSIEGAKFSNLDLFEPSLEEIVEFFDKQILSILFEQTLYESNLSKFAARMLNLDFSITKINQRLKLLSFDIRKNKHKNAEQVQMNTISGLLAFGS